MIDIQNDDGELLQRFYASLPQDKKDPFQKVAQSFRTKTKEDYAAMHDRDFALVFIDKTGSIRRHYPVQEPQDIWASSIYMNETLPRLPKMAAAVAAKNLVVRAQAFGIPVQKEIEKIAHAFPGIRGNVYVDTDTYVDTVGVHEPMLEKMAQAARTSDPKYWGLEINGTRRFPLFHAEHVKTASEYFNLHYRSFEPNQRNEFAKRIVARAAEFDAMDKIAEGPIDDYAGMTKQAGLDHELDLRIDMAERSKNPQAVADYTFLKQAAWAPKEVAAALQHADEKHSFDRYWDKAIMDPYAAVYKGAFQKQASVPFDGEDVTLRDLNAIKEEDFKKVFGQAMWNSFKSDRMGIFDHLPKPEKRVLMNMIR